jgi:hypothetical protein
MSAQGFLAPPMGWRLAGGVGVEGGGSGWRLGVRGGIAVDVGDWPSEVAVTAGGLNARIRATVDVRDWPSEVAVTAEG